MRHISWVQSSTCQITTERSSHFLESYKADVAAFNAHGGADGHPIDLIVCDSQNNANATAACGRQMVSDGVIGVVAVTFGGEYGPYLERAKTASSMTLNDTTLLTNPTVFPLFAGGLAGIPGLAAMGADERCKSMYLIDSASFNPAAQTAIAGQLAGIGKSAHIKTGAIFAPPVLPTTRHTFRRPSLTAQTA